MSCKRGGREVGWTSAARPCRCHQVPAIGVLCQARALVPCTKRQWRSPVNGAGRAHNRSGFPRFPAAHLASLGPPGLGRGPIRGLPTPESPSVGRGDSYTLLWPLSIVGGSASKRKVSVELSRDVSRRTVILRRSAPCGGCARPFCALPDLLAEWGVWVPGEPGSEWPVASGRC